MSINESLARLMGATGSQAGDANELLSYIQQQQRGQNASNPIYKDVQNNSGELIPGALFLRQILGERQKPGMGNGELDQNMLAQFMQRPSFFGRDGSPNSGRPEYVKPTYSMGQSPYAGNVLASLNRPDPMEGAAPNYLARFLGNNPVARYSGAY